MAVDYNLQEMAVNSERGTIVALIDTNMSASVGRVGGKNYLMSPMDGAVDHHLRPFKK